MAGLGRRSHYRKHLTDAVLHDLPEPDESIGQRVARVVGTRGGNMFDVIVAPQGDEDRITKSSGVGENGSGRKEQSTETSEHQPPIQKIQRAPQLAFLPTKFRKLVWIKRNDFVIVECGEDEDEEETRRQKQTSDKQQNSSSGGGGGGFRYVITHILYKDQVKHIKSKGLWPSDPFFANDDTEEAEGSNKDGEKAENGESRPDIHNQEDEPRHQDSTYEDNGIVFDDPYGDDELMVNTNRIATLRVEDSSSEEDSDDE